MSDFTWLVHPEIGIPWQCPTSAIGFWTPRGWELCEPPAEVDPTKNPAPPEQATPDPEPAAPAPAEPIDTADAAADTEGTE